MILITVYNAINPKHFQEKQLLREHPVLFETLKRPITLQCFLSGEIVKFGVTEIFLKYTVISREAVYYGFLMTDFIPSSENLRHNFFL